MPFFKFRRGDAAAPLPAASAAQTQSVEVLRKRARHRLMGASVLVLLGVVGFPLLFETQPRPVAVDIPIEVPGKNSVKPLTMPAPGVAAAPEPAKAPVPAVAAANPPPAEAIYPPQPVPALAEPAPLAIKKEARPESRQEARPEARAETKPKPEQKADARPAPAAEPRPAPRPAAASDDGARATALLNGAALQQPVRPAEAPRPAATEDTKVASAETKGRMVVQVGAFADAAKADETRRRLEKAGLSTYTQIADTKDGKRIRVRVGPFSSKAEAEKAVNKIRSLDLPVAILSF